MGSENEYVPIQTFTPDRNSADGGDDEDRSEFNSSSVSDSQITTGYFDPDVQNYNFTMGRKGGKKSQQDEDELRQTQSHQFKIVRKLKQSVGGKSDYPSHNGSIISHTSEFTQQQMQKKVSSDNLPIGFGPMHKQSSDATQNYRDSFSSKSSEDSFQRKMNEFEQMSDF